MSWANLDDRLHGHPKVRRLQRVPFAGAEALGIWSWSLSWCRAYSPVEGRLCVEDVAADWNADPVHMAEVFELLRTVGLIDEVWSEPEHILVCHVIHDWSDWQLSHQVAAGLARSASARRSPTGQFAKDQPTGPAQTSDTELGQAGSPAGHATPLLSKPRHSTRAPAGPGAVETEFRRRVPEPRR